MKEIIDLLHCIINKLNRLYAHLEIDWDSYSEKELIKKYDAIDLIVEELEKHDLKQ